jgi:hypothetical protein
MQFVVHNGSGDQWFWELRSKHDNELFARSSQGFADHDAAMASVRAVRAAAGVAPTFDEREIPSLPPTRRSGRAAD